MHSLIQITLSHIRNNYIMFKKRFFIYHFNECEFDNKHF